MRIAVDARTVYARTRRGIGKNLMDLYRWVATLRPEWRVTMLHQVDGPDDPYAGLANVEHSKIDMPGDRFNLWQQVRLPLAVRRAGADLLHCPGNTGSRWPLVPMVVTIHDLIPLEPEFLTPEGERWGRTVGAAARKARRILTPSAYSKGQIVKTYGVDADKIVVNPWAPDEGCHRVTDGAELARVRAAYGVEADRPYVFGFAAADPRKNTERILQAWASLPAPMRSEYALVLVGTQAPALGPLRQKARSLGLDGDRVVHGFAPEGDLPALMSGASVLCYASLSEGFGLPLLDAMVCEAAILTSNVTSLPEVAGDAAVLVDPRDAASIADGLRQLLGSRDLRDVLVRRGRERVKQFTWAACAERACRTFEAAVEG